MKRQPQPAEENDTDEEDNANIDPELRLRTVRTAASAIAESVRTEQRAQRRRTRRRFFRARSTSKKNELAAARESKAEASAPAAPIEGARRQVYINCPLPAVEIDNNGDPFVRYARNKVRTTKYTIVTFIPKNLYEQFGRVANLFFLSLIVVQFFPVFGAVNGQISMIPLVCILIITALKDGIEDYRRATLDEEVNTSASTKLGQWRNVNQPTDPRNWFERTLGLNPPGRVTKGVRRLRDREANEGMRVVLNRPDDRVSMASTTRGPGDSSLSLGAPARGHLEDIQSVDSHSYPPAAVSKPSLSGSAAYLMPEARGDSQDWSGSAASFGPRTGVATGVIDYGKRVPGVARWERTLWKKLEVGDVVLLRDNDQVPADIIVLSTSDPEGLCYVETKNLDGETNLKPRKSVKGTAQITSEEDVERATFMLDSEPPHQNLYLYHGVLRYTDPGSGEQKQESVTINELLLRGCSVRNTDWIVGLVVFTGADTKIMLNGGETPSKRSRIERETNFNVVVNFFFLFAICLFTAVGSGIIDGKQDTSSKFYEHGADATGSPVANALVTFISALIAFQNIVPISLYISIEIVKTIQAYFISQDVDMYYQPYDTACVPKTWNISDDLGQIEYVFSDKTGTLTQNIMEFQKCSINGVVYGQGVSEAQRGAAKREGRSDLLDPEEQAIRIAELKVDMLQKMARNCKNRYAQPDKLTIIDPKLAEDLADRSKPQRASLIAFWRALAICHSVLADRPEPQKKPFLTEYKAESPDEAALVAAARDVGFPFVNKFKDAIDIEVMGQPERYTLLKMIEFTSTRKRMSVIVRTPEGKIILYCKGADSVIYERLAADHDPAIKEQTNKDMEAFANGGLRTLCIAYRYMSEEEYFEWSRVSDNAAAAITDRDQEIDKANEQVEHSLHILGATALEDKLQEGVPEAIETLHQAGIKLWILTGDKLQTAIEIGFSCNLLKSDMDVMILSAGSPEAARSQIEAGLNKIASVLGPPSVGRMARGFSPNAKASFAVVIDGDTLRYALNDDLKPLFLNLGTQCETVVCCRVSPAQKALTVKLVKEGRNAMTLSIGDGANDVAMIQEANIGCGLFGLEGSQAAMSADYAFGQFRFLTRLLLVHGRWSYQRIADMHNNFFYKNVIWTFAMFWYLPWNSFDATYLYEYTFILLFNLVFTSLPVIVLGSFDQDINAKAALAFPQLYVRGIRGLEYTRTKFWLFMMDGFYQSLVVYFIPFAIWTVAMPVSWNGKGIDSLADFGTTTSVAAIFAANIYVGMSTHYWTIITWISVIGSSLVMVIWIIIYSFLPSSDFVDEVVVLFGGIPFWTAVILSVSIALLPRFVVKFISTTYFPLDKDIVREMWVKGDLKDRLGIKHRREARQNGLEAAPIYRAPHLRSESERDHPEYIPVSAGSPGTPPAEPSPSMPSTPNERGLLITTTAMEDEDDHRGPPSDRAIGGSSSPWPSVYSASDIPIPSPLPSPRFATHRTVSTPSPNPSQPTAGGQKPRRSSLMVPGQRSSTYGALNGQASIPEYEMRIRPTSLLAGVPGSPHQQHESEMSYAPAREPSPDDHYAQSPVDSLTGQPHDRQEHGSWEGPMAL